MTWTWRDCWLNSRKWLKTGWMICAGMVAVYIGAIAPLQEAREIRTSEATRLGAVSGGRTFGYSTYSGNHAEGIVGGGGGGDAIRVKKVVMEQTVAPAVPPSAAEPAEDRKLVRTCAMELIVKNPAEAAESIRQMAERMGGYLESSQVNGSKSTGSASLTIRVPAAQIEQVRAEIRKLGLRVESDRLEAQDVTKDYVDREARLRNLHAQEEQYLAIMKRAATVKDTLEVSEQLDNVRGQIEQEQAEFNALSKQVETVAIAVSLNAEADAQVFGLSWRPLLRLKIAARDGLNELGDYFASIASFAFFLPTILLWLATILIGAALGWRILKWAGRILFVPRKTALAVKEAN